MQRLFSNFADGWPGAGLLLQRILTAIFLIRFGIIDLTGASPFSSKIPALIGTCAGMLFLVGLWTPIVGVLIAVTELWIAITLVRDPWISVLLATLGGTVATIGPGAWSVDARLFGRRHIEA